MICSTSEAGSRLLTASAAGVLTFSWVLTRVSATGAIFGAPAGTPAYFALFCTFPPVTFPFLTFSASCARFRSLTRLSAPLFTRICG